MIYGARLKYWAWLIVAVFMLLVSKAGNAAITDGKFGVNQIFDVQYYWSGTTLNASNFIAPYDKNFQTVTVTSGQYFQFFASTTNPGKYGLGLYNSNGTLSKVVHDYGDITALGDGAIFYIGSGFFGNVISTAQGYSYGASASFTNMDTSVDSNDTSTYTWASTTPLASGETAAPPAPPAPACNPCSPQGDNLGFESGTTTNWSISNGTGTEKTSGWNSNGEGVQTSKGVVNYSPGGGKTWNITPYGTWMMAIQAGGASPTFDNASTSLGLTAQQITDIKTFLTNQGGNSTPTNASWAKRTVTLEAGKVYVVAWQYLSTDYVPFNDGSMMTLVGPSVPKLNNENKNYALLGFTNPGTGNYATDSYGATGWQLATIEVTVSGEYTLGFASFNLGDTALSPILFVDDLQGATTLNGTNFGPIPPNPGSNAPVTGGGGSAAPACPNGSTCSQDPFAANTGFANRANVWSQQTGNRVIIEQIGNYNIATVQQSGNKNYVELDVLGSNNSTTVNQNTGQTSASNYIEATINGSGNTTSLTQSSTGGNKGIYVIVNEGANNLTVNQSGTGNHYGEIALTGGSKTVDLTQSGSVGHMAKIELSGGATAVTITQSGSTQQNYSINHSCAQSSCAAITVTQGQ
jgi:hypothetical protein